MSEHIAFTARYGLRTHGLGSDLVASRHGRIEGEEIHAHFQETGQCEADPRLQCRCPGCAAGRRQCCQRMTSEDFLCDMCREHCWGVDAARRKHRFIDAYSAS